MNTVKLTIAALVASASASQSAEQLISQALAMTESGSAAKVHLENALSAMTSKSDAQVLESHS